MIIFSRRCALGALIGLVALGAMPAFARTVTDSAGRQVAIPDTVTRVFTAGPPASTLLYVLAPQAMIGWVRAPRDAEKPFLLPAVRDLPELGRLTGRGDTLNLERLIAAKPDLVIDFGSINDTYRSLADRVQAQTGIPYLLIDGRFENTPRRCACSATSSASRNAARCWRERRRRHSRRSTRSSRASPPAKRPRVYLARGPEGIETGTRGSINTEIIERVGGGQCREGLREKGGIVNVSPEQVIAWAPDTIITLDQAFARAVKRQAGMAAGARRRGRPRIPGAQAAIRFHRFAALGEPAHRPHLAVA